VSAVPDDGDINLIPVLALLGSAATGIFANAPTAPLARDILAGFMLFEHLGKELLVGGSIRMLVST